MESFGSDGMCRIICTCARGGPAAGSGGRGPVGSDSIRYKQYIRLVQLRFFVLLARFIRYSSGLSQLAKIIFGVESVDNVKRSHYFLKRAAGWSGGRYPGRIKRHD